MPRTGRSGWLYLFRALAWVACMLAFAACGGRSDQDALAGVADANLVGHDAKNDVPDASGLDAPDVSVDVGPVDALPDVGFPDVRVDARVDGGRMLVGIAITPP